MIQQNHSPVIIRVFTQLFIRTEDKRPALKYFKQKKLSVSLKRKTYKDDVYIKGIINILPSPKIKIITSQYDQNQKSFTEESRFNYFIYKFQQTT